AVGLRTGRWRAGHRPHTDRRATRRSDHGPDPRDPPGPRAAAGLVALLQPRRCPPGRGHHRRPRPALGPGPDPPATGGDGAGLGPAARPARGFWAAGRPRQLTDSARTVGLRPGTALRRP